jgi:hypothetical protein
MNNECKSEYFPYPAPIENDKNEKRGLAGGCEVCVFFATDEYLA